VSDCDEIPVRRRGAPKRALGRWTSFLLAASLLALTLVGRGKDDQTAMDNARDEDAGHKSPPGWVFVAAGLGLIVVVVVAIGLYAGSAGKVSVAAAALLVSAGAFAAGGMLGFLFAVPHVVAPASSTTSEPVLRSSTNLEEISDWLTKILVGLGLVELGKIIASGTEFVDFLKPAFGDTPGSAAVALADITFFAVAGFVALYYITRVFITPALKQVEDDLRKRIASLRAQAQELSGARQEPPAEGEPPQNK
jgi:hypothetical protein